jgi:hypothetical protein
VAAALAVAAVLALEAPLGALEALLEVALGSAFAGALEADASPLESHADRHSAAIAKATRAHPTERFAIACA